MISLSEWMDDVQRYYATKNINDTKDIFNISSCVDLSKAFKVRQIMDLAEAAKNKDKCISLLSLTFIITDSLFYLYDDMFDENNTIVDIDEIVWVDKNDDLPDNKVSDKKLYLSLEMAYDCLDRHYFDDAMRYDHELIEFHTICLQNTDVKNMLLSEPLPKTTERFLNNEVYKIMKGM